jgi:hypothetical protein
MKKFVPVIGFFIVVFCVCAPVLLFAQAGFESTDVADTPIDGGISVLVAMGIGYGAKKLYGKKQIKSQNKNTK